jgi:hypothetical protein
LIPGEEGMPVVLVMVEYMSVPGIAGLRCPVETVEGDVILGNEDVGLEYRRELRGDGNGIWRWVADPFIIGDLFVVNYSPEWWGVVGQLAEATFSSAFFWGDIWRGGWETDYLWFGTGLCICR